jgi:hypothetical protein
MRYLAAIFMIFFTARAEIIDRIAVTVDNRVITESEILRQIRITAFLNGEQPDFSAANKRATADRLVEQILIRRELETTRNAIPGASSSANYQELKQKYAAGEYQKALAKYQITDQDVKEALQWQAVLLDFIDMRFRPGIQVPEADVEDYYKLQAAQNPGKLPPFEEARESIENILTARLVDNAVDRWLGQARTQTRIRYMQEVFR